MIQYITGNALEPIGDKVNKIIAHVCNDQGKWGSGFVVPLGKKFPLAEESYRNQDEYKLGSGKLVAYAGYPGIHVFNMIGQHMLRRDEEGHPPIRYDAVWKCLRTLREDWKYNRYCVSRIGNVESRSWHLPRIGCGLAGGSWSIMREIIKDALQGEDVYVYTLPSETNNFLKNEDF